MIKSYLNEKRIVSEILQGQEKTLRFFYHHFKPSIATYIRKKIATPEDIEEILQDTLLATLEALRDFSFKSSLFTFMCSIANHKIIDFYRKKRIKNIVFSKLADVEPILSTLLGPENSFDEEMLRQKIRNTFTQLSPKYTIILKLKYVYGYSVEEIAQKLSISFKSAESQLFRARKAFVIVFKS